MKTGRIAILALLGIMLLTPLTAYEPTGSGVTITECNNNADDDLDGKTDGNDPGCTSPYYLDDSENNVYDMGAAFVFSNLKNTYSESDIRQKLIKGPSAYYGWAVRYTGTSIPELPFNTYSEGGNDYLNVTYVNNSMKEYGGGNASWIGIQLTDGLTTNSDRNSYPGLVDAPAPDFNQIAYTCGDGYVDGSLTPPEDTLSCPQDAGLPAQEGDAGGTLSEDPSSSGKLTYSVSVDGSTKSDKVIYDVGSSGGDFVAAEYTTEGSSCGGLTNIECDDITSLSSDTTRTLSMDTLNNIPDFYVGDGGTSIYAVYPTISVKEAGSVTDNDVSSTTVDDYDVSEGTEYFSCSGSGCTLKQDSVCRDSDRTEETPTSYSLSTDHKTVTYDSEEFTTSSDGSTGYTSSDPTQPMSIRVEHDDVSSSSTSYYSCDSLSTPVECDTSSDPCDLSDSETSYSASSHSYNDQSSPATKTYDIKTVQLKTKKIFDLDPGVTNDLTDSDGNEVIEKELLFDDTFTSWDTDISAGSFSNEGWFAYNRDHDDRDQGNDPAITPTNFLITTDSNGNFKSTRDQATTYDADGQNGLGDGFIAISNGKILGASNGFLEYEFEDGSTVNYATLSDVKNSLDISCPSGTSKCVASVDVNLTDLNQWSSMDPNTGLSFHYSKGNPYGVETSMGVCKTFQELAGGDWTTKCERDTGGSTLDSDDPVCGDQTGSKNEFYIYMEGPEVDEDYMESEKMGSAYEACVHTEKAGHSKDSCVLEGKVVPEGYVGNVAPSQSNDKFEEGGNSPDWEVCLDLQGTGITSDEGDEVAGDNKEDDINKEDYGGEWYDLDSENAQEYLRNSGNNLIVSSGSSDHHNITYYWNSQINPPQDSTYNPEGGKAGIALEDDCGNPRFDSIKCNDAGTATNRQATFYSFFEEGRRDEDFHPQGEDEKGENLQGFTGVTNRLQEQSNQLEPGMETGVYSSSDYNMWEDTRNGDYADDWAISRYLNWSIDSTGTPYPPYSAWYRDPSDQREEPSDPDVEKMQKAFGNSYSAVATTDFQDANGVQVNAGDGVWIDPDSMKSVTNVKLTPDGQGWREALRRTDPKTGLNSGFKLDLTGEDAGLGMDTTGTEECLAQKSDGGCKVVASDIDWEKNGNGNIVDNLERPMCGDDRHEFLIESAGESESSKKYTGPYACADSLNSCYSPEEGTVVEQGVYADAGEAGEDVGRLKDDEELCQKNTTRDGNPDDFAVWYDQDYSNDICDTNTLYGQNGVRWFDAEYVNTHPKAVQGGIDDSWSDYLAQIQHRKYESQIGQTGSGITPVPTGDNSDYTATLGFCGGDDESEYLVTQNCNTRYCQTDRTVQGVAKVPGSCVFDEETVPYDTNEDERKIFQPGEQVTITSVSGNPSIACFNGAWFSQWPINFNEEKVEVPLGETRTVSFEVINIRNTETTFRVTMGQSSDSPSADQFASFVEHEGDSFTTTVDPTSSKTFRVEITGGNKNLDFSDPGSDLAVTADAINAGLVGTDYLGVDITKGSPAPEGSASRTRDVPGIGAVQLLLLVMLSTLVFFRRR